MNADIAAWLYAELLLFLAGCYMQLRVEIAYCALTRLRRHPSLPPLAEMAWHPGHQLRWTPRQWSRWTQTRVVLL